MTESQAIDSELKTADMHRRRLRWPTYVLLMTALMVAVLALTLPWAWSDAFGLPGAVLIIISAVQLTVLGQRTWHARLHHALANQPDAAVDDRSMRRIYRRALTWHGQLGGLVVVLASTLAAALTWWTWPVDPMCVPLPIMASTLLLMAAFPLLVWQRSLAMVAEEHQDQRSLHGSRLTTAALAVIIAVGGLHLASGLGWQWSPWGISVVVWFERILALVTVVVATELALRGIALGVLPAALNGQRVPLESRVVTWLIALPSGRLLADLEQDIGLELQGHWAMVWIRRRAWWLFAVSAMLVWSSTMMTTIRVDERGVYERFGHPQAVLTPGLHVHLPWPLGQVKRTDFGRIHSINLATAMPSAGGAVERFSEVTDDRLWDVEHPNEVYFLTASTAQAARDGEREHRRVELINADLVVRYAIGEDDQDVLNALYRVTQPGELLARLTRRHLQLRFATATPDLLIATDREQVRAVLEEDLQQELDALQTGLQIQGIAIEAIHPPLTAAPAFFALQGAELEASSAVDHARGRAERIIAHSRTQAMRTGQRSLGVVSERMAQAEIVQQRFAAQVTAHALNSDAYRFERQAQLLTERWSDLPLVVIDHRIDTPYGHDVNVGDPGERIRVGDGM